MSDDQRKHPATKDPVCGMDVVPGQARGGSAGYAGRTYWFCSSSCREKFVADPRRYVEAEAAGGGPAKDERQYTCPMHPEVRRSGPGSCPICGMALEPMAPGVNDEPDPELVDMARRFWIGLVLTIPLLVFVMGDMFPGEPLRHLVPGRVLAWLQLVLATPVVLWAGWPFFVRGWASIVNRSLNMFTLIAIGTGMAYVYSVVGTMAPGMFPDSFRTHGGEIGLYFEAAAVITVLVLRRGRAVSGVLHSPQPDHRQRGDDLQLGVGDRECAAIAPGETLTS